MKPLHVRPENVRRGEREILERPHRVLGRREEVTSHRLATWALPRAETGEKRVAWLRGAVQAGPNRPHRIVATALSREESFIPCYRSCALIEDAYLMSDRNRKVIYAPPVHRTGSVESLPLGHRERSREMSRLYQGRLSTIRCCSACCSIARTGALADAFAPCAKEHACDHHSRRMHAGLELAVSPPKAQTSVGRRCSRKPHSRDAHDRRIAAPIAEARSKCLDWIDRCDDEADRGILANFSKRQAITRQIYG